MTALYVLCSDFCNNIHFSIVFFLGFCVAATEAHGLKKILMEVGENEKMSSLVTYFRLLMYIKVFCSFSQRIHVKKLLSDTKSDEIIVKTGTESPTQK
jgi:hypothetical protein